MFKRWSCALVMATLVVAMFPLPGVVQAGDWLPAPTGSYQVGTTTYHWIDGSRPELFTENPNDRRELLVRVWYPAEVDANATPEPYAPHPDIIASFPAEVVTEGIDIGISLSVEEFVFTPTHSYRDAPLSDAEVSYPVLVFSHGWASRPEFHTAQIEELASHGYVVVGIVHTHVALLTVFPDRRIVPFSNPDQTLTREVGAQDQSFVLDKLAILNEAPADERFSGRLALDRVGVFGMSWGAHVTPLACLQDSRFTAAILEDGSRLPVAVYRAGLDLPIMFMKREGTSDPVAIEQMRGPVYMFIFNGFGHMDFSDFTLFPGVSSSDSGLFGGVQGSRAAQVVNAYILAFFDQYIKGVESPLLDGPSSDYSEVEFEVHNQ